MPILYEVSVKIPPEIAMDFEIYMTREHIPAILASGCFSNAEFARRGAGEYRTAYRAESREDLDRYLERFAGGLRSDFVKHFKDAEVSRAEFESLSIQSLGEHSRPAER